MNLKIKNIIKKVGKTIGLMLGTYNPIVVKMSWAFLLYLILYELVPRYLLFVTDYYGYVLSLVYWVLVFAEIIREHCFAIKWYNKKFPKSIECPSCHSLVHLENPQQGRGLYTFPTAAGYDLRDMLVFFYRPRLHLHCPHCGLDEIVCPYCDKPISEDDKKCPHCGKRVLREKTLILPPLW